VTREEVDAAIAAVVGAHREVAEIAKAIDQIPDSRPGATTIVYEIGPNALDAIKTLIGALSK
jgi:hypothetical protein